MNELLAIGLIAIAAVLVRAVVRLLLARFSIVPADAELRSRGFKDVLVRLRDRRSNR